MRHTSAARLHLFQPTLPARGATPTRARSPFWKRISTHAPRTGSDAQRGPSPRYMEVFQPTLPARGATRRRGVLPALRRISTHAPRTGSDKKHPGIELQVLISTHAPRTGSDVSRDVSGRPGANFNPRSPHGERRPIGCKARLASDFNPRSPHGERR